LAVAYNVVITDCPWADNSIEKEILETGGISVARCQCTLVEEVIAVGKDADALLVGWAPITREVIQALTRCRLIMRYGTGYNNIDVEAATQAGIQVAINAEYCVEEVATHALTLLLACHRQLSALTEAVSRGVWDPLAIFLPTPPLSEQTVGIVGYGKIGQCFAGMVRHLARQVLIYDPLFMQQMDEARKFAPFDQVLRECDYISIHAPLTPETRHMFSRQSIAEMKKGAYLINCARGPLVDEEALVEALREGHLGGAGLDVFSVEPLPMDHPLRTSPRVIITPHVAWYSTRAEYLLRALPAKNILRFLRGEQIPVVNDPVPRSAAGNHAADYD
jgi:D-3-phosphoglycerate dehydrogenase